MIDTNWLNQFNHIIIDNSFLIVAIKQLMLIMSHY